MQYRFRYCVPCHQDLRPCKRQALLYFSTMEDPPNKRPRLEGDDRSDTSLLAQLDVKQMELLTEVLEMAGVITELVDLFSELPDELKMKQWEVEDFFSRDGPKRVLMPLPIRSNAVQGIETLLTRDLTKKVIRCRVSQQLTGETFPESIHLRFVELFNGACRPETCGKKVWLGDPTYKKDALGGIGGFGHITLLMTEVVKEQRKNYHDKRNATIEYYAGKTLHEIIMENEQFRIHFPIGKRHFAASLQDIICKELEIPRNEFGSRHRKMKHEHSENYFIQYRPEEIPIIIRYIGERVDTKLKTLRTTNLQQTTNVQQTLCTTTSN